MEFTYLSDFSIFAIVFVLFASLLVFLGVKTKTSHLRAMKRLFCYPWR